MPYGKQFTRRAAGTWECHLVKLMILWLKSVFRHLIRFRERSEMHGGLEGVSPLRPSFLPKGISHGEACRQAVARATALAVWSSSTAVCLREERRYNKPVRQCGGCNKV